eukprot:scaffold2738_cov119-Cylindrotheca_fusiformis.AAC.16
MQDHQALLSRTFYDLQLTHFPEHSPSQSNVARKVKASELLQISNFTWNSARKHIGAKKKVSELPQISNFTWNGTRKSQSQRDDELFSQRDQACQSSSSTSKTLLHLHNRKWPKRNVRATLSHRLKRSYGEVLCMQAIQEQGTVEYFH